MTQGRTPRIIGSIGIGFGGLLSAGVVIAQFGILSILMSGSSGATALGSLSRLASALGVVGSVIVLIGYVFLAVARGRSGMFDTSSLPRIGFIVLAVAFLFAELFFLVAPRLVAASEGISMTALNRGFNVLLIAAIVFAAVTMLIKGERAGFGRVVLFLPALLLIVIQFSLVASYPGYLLPQAVYQLSWVVVGISYLAARSRGSEVTAAPESLAE